MFELRREVLFGQLLSQMESGSVLVTGAPGIGKSWLIGRLLGHLKQTGRFVLPLIAEEYEVSTLEELQQALKLKGRLETLLAKHDRAVLLIDGLDALRAEGSQRVFRDLIIRILKNAPSVTVVASIRSFDLAESPVFSSLSSFIPGLGKPFSSVFVGALNDEEVDQVRRERSGFDDLWTIANSDTRQLLRTPFNLVIALSLMKDGLSSTNLSGIGSQVALLDEFWRRRVESVSSSLERKKVLRILLERMITLKTLSVAEVDIENVELAPALHETLSVELLRKNVTGRIFFAHNILFDYALARIILDEVRLPAFLAEDNNRSLYYRPSLNFFFGHVWLADRTLFWKIVDKSLAADIFPESVKVIPAVVVCQMAEQASDLEPLESAPDSATQAFLRKVLVGVQALGIPINRRNLWINFVSVLSQKPTLSCINELLSVLSVLKDAMRSDERARLNSCARSVIEWSWTFDPELAIAQRVELTGVVSGRLLPIVLRTLYDSAEDSKDLIVKILKRIGTPGASSRELFWLANDMDLIVGFSPSLAATVYESVYGYKEQSEEQVSIGGGSVLNLTSSEGQQYESLFYQLGAKFHVLMNKDFPIAARTAVRIANLEILRERPLNEDQQLLVSKMRLSHRLVSYVSDYSEIWDSSSSRDYTSLQMFDSSVRFATDGNKPADLHGLVNAIFTDGGVAVLFKRLFEAGSRAIKIYGDILKPYLFGARFISAPEVTIAIGEFIKQLSTVESSDGKFWEALESTVLKIPNSKPLLRYERPKSIQIRLLACFKERLRNPRSRTILEEADEPRPNRPFYEVQGGAIASDSPQVYRMRGIDPENPINSALIKATEAVKAFAYRSPNAAHSLDDVEAVFPSLVHLAEVLVNSESASNELLVNGRGTLYAAVSAMSLVKEIKVDSHLFDFELSAAITGASDPEPVFDAKYHLPFDTPGWGSPSPRIEASQAIVNLIWNYREDRRALPVFRRLMSDPVPAVRYQIARGLVALYVQEDLRDDFWESLRGMLGRESTNGVTLGLLQSLSQIAGREPSKTMAVLSDYIEENYRTSEKSDVMRSVVGICAGLFLAYGTPEARVQLRRFERDFGRYHRELSQMVLAAGQHITPADGTEVQRERAREIWESVLNALVGRANELYGQAPPRDFHDVVRVLDTLISRLFFSFDLIGTRAPGQEPLDNEQRKILFGELNSIIERIVQADEMENDRDIPLIPHTAHYFLQLMNGVLEFAPDDVLRYAYAICKRGARTGYLEDSMARAEAVKLVEKALADFRDRLKQPGVATAVSGMLDLFTKHGWPEAVTLTFKLEDAFR